MANARSGIFAVTAIVVTLIGCSNCFQRTLDYAFNEGCDELCKNKNVRLGHVKAVGPNDTLHYLWDFSENPTILIAATSSDAKLRVNWHDYITRTANSVNFTEKPIYTFGVVIERLLEFDDVNDKARIDEIPNSSISELKLQNFQWKYKNITKNDNLVEFYIEANNYKDPKTNEKRNGTLKFQMHGFGSLNHSHISPHMLHSENATEIDIVIDHLETKKDFSKSRFALELLIISESDPSIPLNLDIRRKLDDEFTPGIFELMELTSPAVYRKSGYLQWRPVSYIDSDRAIEKSISTVLYPVKDATVNDYFMKNDFLYVYYGEDIFNNLVQRMNISFGEKGDNYYKDTQYFTWTFLLGYGTSPDERFSGIVIMIISIGVGLPILILTITGIYLCMRRASGETSQLISR